MAPKKTQNKMSIGDFLSDQSLGSWADEMDSQPLPSPSGFGGERRAFSSAGGFGGDRAGGFGDRGGFADRGARPGGFSRDALPLPSKPPYTAHLGNLSFEVTEGDVQDFLSGCEVTSVRIVEDKLENRPKGFGYVEFGTVEGLKKALALSESQFQGRNIRISVAEPQRADARELNDWSRKGPLPDLPGQGGSMRRGAERSGSFRNDFGGSDAGSERGGERRRPAFFEGGGDGKSRDFNTWERKGPLTPTIPEARQGGRAPREFGSSQERKASPSWGEGRSEAGSRPPRREFSERAPVERAPTAADQDSQWRTKMKPDAPSPSATPDISTPSSPAAAAAPTPAYRPRLNLQKRTVSEAPEQPADAGAGAASDAKASPFGAARPIDTSARERAIEEKREQAVRQKKEQDDKAREEKRARDAATKTEKPAAGEKELPKETAAPRENGKSDRKGSEAASPQPGLQYEILRRMENDEETEAVDGVDAPANGEIVGDKETKPQEVTREVPKGESGAWRKQSTTETTAEELQDDGFEVVGGRQKKGRNNKAGGGGGRALAS